MFAKIFDKRPVEGSESTAYKAAVGPIAEDDVAKWAGVVRVDGEPYVPVGKVTSSTVQANVGDVIEVDVSEMVIDDEEPKMMRWASEATALEKSGRAASTVEDILKAVDAGDDPEEQLKAELAVKPVGDEFCVFRGGQKHRCYSSKAEADKARQAMEAEKRVKTEKAASTNIGKWLRKQREERMVFLHDLAEAMGVELEKLLMVEEGLIVVPPDADLQKAAELLNMEFSDFMAGISGVGPEKPSVGKGSRGGDNTARSSTTKLEPKYSISKMIPNEEREERFALGVVLEPETVDAQGDIYSAGEIRKAAHEYMAAHQTIGIQHKRKAEGVKILESYIAPADFEIEGQEVKKGSWLIGARFENDTLWSDVKAGRLTGWSIGGAAVREPDEIDVSDAA